jgi:hypothetical protein
MVEGDTFLYAESNRRKATNAAPLWSNLRVRNVTSIPLNLSADKTSWARLAQTGAAVALLIAVSVGEETTVSASTIGSPADVMRKVAENEVKAADNELNRVFFRGVKITPKGSATHIYVQTKQATTGQLIATNGHPLTANERQSEEDRIERFINNPEELKKKCEQDHETAERTMRIVRALPDAFLFTYAGQEAGTETIGRTGTTLLKFTFHPNPAYQPPTRVEEVLTGLQGYVLIDPKNLRLAAIDGTLFKDVAFGWGILGHLNKGSRFAVQQVNLDDKVWQVSGVTLNFTGKVLMLKSINVNTTEVFSGFQGIPPEFSLVQALEFMKHQSASISANSVAANLGARKMGAE